MTAKRYAGMGEKDWQHVDRALHITRMRGIKWGA